ncbi:MAG: hypothetical protein LBP28_04235, partial [Coriobacteriales bacterium]|nr:hypothetical protein [Coriobacteriales bacterium]
MSADKVVETDVAAVPAAGVLASGAVGAGAPAAAGVAGAPTGSVRAVSTDDAAVPGARLERRPRVAICGLCGCGGCQMQILDAESHLAEAFAQFELVSWPLLLGEGAGEHKGERHKGDVPFCVPD